MIRSTQLAPVWGLVLSTQLGVGCSSKNTTTEQNLLEPTPDDATDTTNPRSSEAPSSGTHSSQTRSSAAASSGTATGPDVDESTPTLSSTDATSSVTHPDATVTTMVGPIATASASSGQPGAPLDCAALVEAGFEVCDTEVSHCGVVFENGAGCIAACAAAGMTCAVAYENLDDGCGPDLSRAPIACDSGHESDYCRCEASTGEVTSSEGDGATASPDTSESPSSEPTITQNESTAAPTTTAVQTSEPVGNSGDAPCAVPSYIFADPLPVGWATEGNGTTGGGNATPELVTTLSALKSAVSGDTPRVIFVQGDLEAGDLNIGANKTIVGCSESAHLHGSVSIGGGVSNVVLRNLTISGYAVGNCALDPAFDESEGCSSGSDAVGIKSDAHHVWVDHCSIKDGTDGNLDVTNNADFVTISWTKFSYTPRTDNVGNDSTGAAGHRYSNLVGGTDSAPEGWPGTIPLNVTWHHNWWADNVVERQPRVRYGRNHIFNNYYNSSSTNYCVRAGIEASVLLQGNYFDAVDTPHAFNNEDDEATAFIALGSAQLANVYEGTSGDRAEEGGGEMFEPPYPFAVELAADVPTVVMSGAGPH